MKKITFLFVMLFAASITFAQVFQAGTATSKKFNHEISTVKSATDTAGISASFLPQFASGGQVVAYTDMSGGYVFGVNGNAFKAVAQGYTMVSPGPIGIDGVCMLFCGKKSVSNDATSKLTFSIFHKLSTDSIPTTQVGTITADLLFSDCDTSFLTMNTAMFPSVIAVNGDFSVVCSLLNIKTDTIGFLSDQQGEGIGFTAFKYNSTWMTYRKGYGGLMTNISLFAIVDVNFVGVEDNYFFQGSKMTINQNPATDNLSISYAVENDSKVTFELMSLNGQVVLKQDEGFRTKGSVYSINSNISNLASGTYLCSLISNGQRLIKKVVVE